ncbi:LexA family protein [Eoetvoesiella caeni]|nr:S24 family peptidase [Eoetvoesiella caeni]MCI2809358.1 S24 family peptidase [Eoetvoesiella caeni]
MHAPVPLISWVKAGDWCGVVDNFSPGDAEEWLPIPRAHGPNAYALRVRGVSMEPRYRDGSIIFVDPSKQADHGSNVVVRMDNEAEATFKQLVVEGDTKFLRALNPDWPGPKLIEINSSATICGVVIGQFIPD